jgi:hypothetical protein
MVIIHRQSQALSRFSYLLIYLLTNFKNNNFLSLFEVSKKNELVVSSSFFGNYSEHKLWKIELEILIDLNNDTIIGAASLNFKMNTLPRGGYCNVSTDNGTSLETLYYIMCQEWVDDEGKIEAYEFFGKFLFL